MNTVRLLVVLLVSTPALARADSDAGIQRGSVDREFDA